MPVVSLMWNCVAELYGLDLKLSYQHAFVYIRQLAIHLRTAIINKTKVGNCCCCCCCCCSTNALSLSLSLTTHIVGSTPSGIQLAVHQFVACMGSIVGSKPQSSRDQLATVSIDPNHDGHHSTDPNGSQFPIAFPSMNLVLQLLARSTPRWPI
jgi:hypothetical protein